MLHRYTENEGKAHSTCAFYYTPYCIECDCSISNVLNATFSSSQYSIKNYYKKHAARVLPTHTASHCNICSISHCNLSAATLW